MLSNVYFFTSLIQNIVTCYIDKCCGQFVQQKPASEICPRVLHHFCYIIFLLHLTGHQFIPCLLQLSPEVPHINKFPTRKRSFSSSSTKLINRQECKEKTVSNFFLDQYCYRSFMQKGLRYAGKSCCCDKSDRYRSFSYHMDFLTTVDM